MKYSWKDGKVNKEQFLAIASRLSKEDLAKLGSQIRTSHDWNADAYMTGLRSFKGFLSEFVLERYLLDNKIYFSSSLDQNCVVLKNCTEKIDLANKPDYLLRKDGHFVKTEVKSTTREINASLILDFVLKAQKENAEQMYLFDLRNFKMYLVTWDDENFYWDEPIDIKKIYWQVYHRFKAMRLTKDSEEFLKELCKTV